MPGQAPHVVVLGAGFGGLAVAAELGGTGIPVTVVDRNNYHLFAPLLYQVATAALSPADIAEPIRKILRRHRNVSVVLAEVSGIDATQRMVRLGESRILHYDRLVIAIGSSGSYFGHDEWARYAPTLKTLTDARRVRSRILLGFEQAEMEDDPAVQSALMTIAIVGGGPTGVEMAGAVWELARYALAQDFRRIRPPDATILLIEAGPRLLAGFPEPLGRYAARRLERMGVTLLLGQPVQDVSETGVTVGGRLIPTRTVIWGAGVQASPAHRWLNVPADKAGRIEVAADLSVPGLDGVYALGDSALCRDERGAPLPGLAQVAKQQGKHLGRALAAHVRNGTPLPPFRYRNRGNAGIIGRNAAFFDFGRWYLRGRPAWLLWAIIHIMLLVGFEHRVLVSIQWLWRYLTYQRGARLITDYDR